MRKTMIGLALTAVAAVGVVSASAGRNDVRGHHCRFDQGRQQEGSCALHRQLEPGCQRRWKSRSGASELGMVVGGSDLQRGPHFPKCTAAQIDAAQSDSVCPKGSLIGSVSPAEAALGPVSDPTQSVSCKGKTISIYNAGASKVTWFTEGPGEQCAGVGYLAPFTAALKKVGNSTHTTLTWPPNIVQPLPGVEGGFNLTNTTYFKVAGKPKKGKKGKSFYATSIACKGSRDFTVIIVDTEGKKTTNTTAGKCKASPKPKKKK